MQVPVSDRRSYLGSTAIESSMGIDGTYPVPQHTILRYLVVWRSLRIQPVPIKVRPNKFANHGSSLSTSNATSIPSEKWSSPFGTRTNLNLNLPKHERGFRLGLGDVIFLGQFISTKIARFD